MTIRHSFSTDDDVTKPKRTERLNSTERLQAGTNWDVVARHLEDCTSTINRLCVRNNNTGNTKADLGQADRKRPPQPMIDTSG